MMLFLVIGAVLLAFAECRTETELDEYVWRPDDTYRWEVMTSYWEEGVTTYTILLYSQTWYTEEVHSHPEWWHHLMVSVPDEVTHHEVALLFIEGGNNNNQNPPSDDESFIVMTRNVARDINSVTALLKQVPNQPIQFWDDPSERRRSEDALIAWTWEEFRLNKTGGAFLARAPMTKAAVKAMDAMTEFTDSLEEPFSLSKFFVTGGSKRGWTAWTTAAVDDERVIAFSPIVLSCLNFVDNIHHHYQAYGGYSWVMQDYYDVGLTTHLIDPDLQRMFDIVDPIAYKDRYTMPKYVMCAAGDEFFLPDDTYYFWDELQGPKYLNVIPNAEHTLVTRMGHVYRCIRSFWYAVITEFPLPNMTWDLEWTETGGKITAYMDTVPSSVAIYTATTISKTQRDFRLAKPFNSTGPVVPNPVLWTSSEATMVEETVYTGEVENPDGGWRGMILEARFPGPKEGEEWELVFTTEVLITPNYLPFPKCQTPEECQGTLL